ncbi:MAG TPA: nuclear transport factor 2 family protein [Pseudonocardia sp.]|nr:nuclear transport factor 2 family protein [Pseudonocardia sp.]
MVAAVAGSAAARLVHDLLDDVWNRGLLDRVPRYLHPEYRQIDERAEVSVRGHDEFVRSVQGMRQLLDVVDMSLTHVVASGPDVAYRWRLLGRVRDAEVLSPAMRLMARHVPEVGLITVTGVNFAVVRDGLLVEEISELDPQAVAQQMGWWG